MKAQNKIKAKALHTVEKLPVGDAEAYRNGLVDRGSDPQWIAAVNSRLPRGRRN